MKKIYLVTVFLLFINNQSFADIDKVLQGKWKISLICEEEIQDTFYGKFKGNSFDVFRDNKTYYYNYYADANSNQFMLAIEFMDQSFFDVKVITKDDLLVYPKFEYGCYYKFTRNKK